MWPQRAAMHKVNVYNGWCKKCGICVAFCPRHVLTMGHDGYPTVSNPDACTGCRWCELRCPDFAIVVEEPDDESREAKDD